MRIAFLLGTDGLGGLELNQIKSAKSLEKLGHHTWIICRDDAPIFEKAKQNNLNIELIKAHKNHYDFLRAFQLKQILKRNKIEHLVIRSVFDMSIAASAKFLLRKKINVHYFMEMQMLHSKKAWYRTIRYSFFDSWVCPLNYMANQVRLFTKIPKEKIYIIPSGVEEEFFNTKFEKVKVKASLGLPIDKILFGIVGRIDQKKNQLLALEAFHALNNKNGYLIFIGQRTPNAQNDVYLDLIRNYINDNHLENQVLFTGQSDNVLKYYQALDWTVVPSENESVGMVTLESLAVGTPVIGSNSGGTKEILENSAGLLFKSGDVQSLTYKINEAIEKESVPFNDRMREYLEKHRFSHVSKILEAHFKKFESNN